jgi:hypothetical protein
MMAPTPANAEECRSWYLLPAIERSLAGLVSLDNAQQPTT